MMAARALLVIVSVAMVVLRAAGDDPGVIERLSRRLGNQVSKGAFDEIMRRPEDIMVPSQQGYDTERATVNYYTRDKSIEDPDYLFTSGGLVYNDTFDPWTDSSGSAWMRTRIDPHSKKAPKKTALPKPVKVPSSMKVF